MRYLRVPPGMHLYPMEVAPPQHRSGIIRVDDIMVLMTLVRVRHLVTSTINAVRYSEKSTCATRTATPRRHAHRNLTMRMRRNLLSKTVWRHIGLIVGPLRIFSFSFVSQPNWRCSAATPRSDSKSFHHLSQYTVTVSHSYASLRRRSHDATLIIFRAHQHQHHQYSSQ